MKEWIIGFDVREMWYRDHKIIGGFGFRGAVDKFLTIDPSIWGRIFDDGECFGISGDDREKIGLGKISLPRDIGVNSPLWDDLENLNKYIENNIKNIKTPIWTIAITCMLKDVELIRKKQEWPYLNETKPPKLDKNWKLVGYDIVTKYFECRLSGSATLNEEQEKYLNKYHLFSDAERANDLKVLLDNDEKEDAPHFVFGIWLVKKIEN